MATRILVVDDSPTIRTVVSTLLERSGYDPKVAADGQDAYDALSSGEVEADLVLVDFVMPRMNGYQFCRALRANAELASMPVVLMSAKGDRIRDQFVQQTGALDVITKPFDAQALVAVIENALRKVNTVRGSSSRLPDIEDDDDDDTDDAQEGVEYETKRTHLAQIVVAKLASVAASAIANQPDIASSPNLAGTLAERLTNEAILEMVEAIVRSRRDGTGVLLSGDLGAIPVGAILQLLQTENQTGVLVCTNGDAEVRTTFRGGAIDLVEASGAGAEFRLGRFFVEEGIVTPAELDAIIQGVSPAIGARRTSPVAAGRGADERGSIESDGEKEATVSSEPVRLVEKKEEDPEAPRSAIQMKESTSPDTSLKNAPSATPPSGSEHQGASVLKSASGGANTAASIAAAPRPRPLGMALLSAGKIEESQLRSALTRQSSELLYEVLRWPGGRFELHRGPPSELAENAKLGLPVASVVMEGFRRVDEWRVLERTLGSFDAVLFRDDAAFGALDNASLPHRERAVLEAVDGVRTVRAVIAASNLSSFDACRILVQFLEARALRRRAG